MASPPPLSDREWKIMSRLWDQSPQSAYDLIETFSRSERWHPNTVRTMLARLVAKGALDTERYKNLFLYHPKVDREACVRAESDSFLRKVFGGALKPLLVHFASREPLTDAEARELRRLLSPRRRK